MLIDFQKLHKDAVIPEYATDGSGAFDLFAVSYRKIFDNVYEYDLGFAVAIPKDYSLFILSRSGQGFKYQTRLSNCVGLIDSDYRGVVKVQLFEDFAEEDAFGGYYSDVTAYPYDDLSKAVAQGVILHTPKVQFNVVDELPRTLRGNGGFGSTNK